MASRRAPVADQNSAPPYESSPGIFGTPPAFPLSWAPDSAPRDNNRKRSSIPFSPSPHHPPLRLLPRALFVRQSQRAEDFVPIFPVQRAESVGHRGDLVVDR